MIVPVNRDHTAIILLSHGSVLCGSERNLFAIASELRHTWPRVEAAFLNYTRPKFEDILMQVVSEGATSVCIAPFFLIEGKFLKEDLPPLLAEARANHPEVNFVTALPIGFHDALADAVLASAAEAAPIDNPRAELTTAAAFCRRSPKCPLHGTDSCPATSEAAS